MCYNLPMRHPLWIATSAASLLSALLLTVVGPLRLDLAGQQEGPAALWLSLVNEIRIDEGLDPYRQSRLLTDAAQRHADDLAANGFADPNDAHVGSDGTHEQERIEEAGYAAWMVNEDRMVVAESVWSGSGTAEDALASLFGDPAERPNFLNDAYREIGIGVANDPGGRGYCVLGFGARPNVLPIFINDGAPSTENREVAIRLTNERVQPEGRGAGLIGEAIEIRIGNQPEFKGLPWQSWAPLVSWTLPDATGEHTVYVQFRDAAGRTAASADNIYLDQGTPALENVTAPASSPGQSETSVPPSPAREPISFPESDATVASPASMAAPTVSPGDASAALTVTPFPTWTPLPSPQPTGSGADQSKGETLSLPEVRDYGKPLVAVGILQGVAVVLGLYLALRGGRSM
ncbi:MAG: CAP domain-containing protein [Anaerolineae bacterium]